MHEPEQYSPFGFVRPAWQRIVIPWIGCIGGVCKKLHAPLDDVDDDCSTKEKR